VSNQNEVRAIWLVHFDKAQTIMTKVLGPEHSDVATGYYHVGSCKKLMGQLEGACRAFKQAHTIYSNMNTSSAQERATVLSEYIVVLSFKTASIRNIAARQSEPES